MAKQLNIRSDEAYEIASRISKATGRSRADVVHAALLRYAETKIGRRMTEEERAFVDELMALADKAAEVAPSGMTSDLSDMYGADGLPR
jgi:hypothetical protein